MCKKLHKLLHQGKVLLIFIIMILCPIESRNCNRAVRTIQLYSEFTKGHVRIEGKKVVASSSINYMDQTLQMITIDRHYFLLYDPNAKMFICWNRMYTNLMAKRNPKNLTPCKFEEKTSIKRPAGMTRYTTTFFSKKEDKFKEVELRFNKAGAFAYPRITRKCLEKRRRGGRGVGGGVGGAGGDHTRHLHNNFNIDLMMNIDTLNIDPESKRAYVQLSKYCADPDFIVHLVHKNPFNCSLGYYNFCGQMKRIHQHHRLNNTLSNFCNL